MAIEWLKKLLFPSTGVWAERKVAKFLRHSGLKILKCNYHAHHSEIDIIAVDGRQLVYVEVRARNAKALVPGAQTLDHHKRNCLRRGIAAYNREYLIKTGNPPSWRFDVVEVSYETRRKFIIYHYPCTTL